MNTHLPPDEFLAEYAGGTASPAVELLLTAHLTHSAPSRERVGQLEAACGTMLADEAPAAMSATALDDVLARLDDDPAPAEITTESVLDKSCQQPVFPRPLMDRIGMPFDSIPWKFKLPGVSTYELNDFGEETVQILRARPGVSVPKHTHKGVELTLVLQGVLEDNGIEYHAGDIAVNDEDDDHRPSIRGTETCYCLIVQQGDLHFTGRFSRILNYLGE